VAEMMMSWFLGQRQESSPKQAIFTRHRALSGIFSFSRWTAHLEFASSGAARPPDLRARRAAVPTLRSTDF